MKAAIYSVLVVLLAGCASVTPESQAVRIVHSEGGLQGCEYITSVRGDQNLYGGAFLARAAYEDALHQMRNRTVQAGGNTLYIASAQTGMIGANAMGDAYRC